MQRQLILSILLSLAYWIPSSIVLYDIFTDDGIVFSNWIDTFLFPGYLLGFALGFGGGNLAAIIGQVITIAIISTIIFGLLSMKKGTKR